MIMTNSEQWENKTQAELAADRYRFNGERYSFRGTATWGPDDWIPQEVSLFAFPKESMLNPPHPQKTS
jgi:hypothetical protein